MATEPEDQRLSELLGRVTGEARQAADALLRRVLSVLDRQLRKPVLGEQLHAMDDSLLLAVLSDLLLRARRGHTDCRELVQELALEPGLVTHLPYERVQALYALSTRHELLDVRALFLSTRSLDRRESHTENDYLSLPLGARKQAARTRDRFLLDRLLRDRNVDVIRNLLQNPRLTERDILLIAAMRPTRPEILELVASHPRWSSRYRVRKALACNPHTPSAIALSLLSTLLIQDLRFLVGSGVMAPEVQSEARRLLERADRRRGAGRRRAAGEGLDRDIEQLVDGWQRGAAPPAEGVLGEVGEVSVSVPTSEAVRAAHLAAEKAARQRVLETLEYPDPELRSAYLPEPEAVVLREDLASPEELEREVSRLIDDWLILDPSISAEMVAMAAFTEVEAADPNEAPKVGWPEEAPSPEPPAREEAAPQDPLAREVAKLLSGWRQRDAAISDELLAAADGLEIEAYTPGDGADDSR